MNSNKLPWRRIITEGSVIVVSILLAFAIDAWWNERIERAQEREHLQSMRDEFKTSIDGAKAILESIQTHAADVDSLIASLKTVEQGQSITVSDKILGSINMWRTTDVSTSTLNALMSSGNLNQLSNPELRAELAGLPALILDMTEDEILSQKFAENTMSVHLVKLGLAEIVYANRGGDDEVVKLFQKVPKEITVPHTPELIGLLTIRRVHLAYSEVTIPGVVAYLEKLIAMIDEELGE